MSNQVFYYLGILISLLLIQTAYAILQVSYQAPTKIVTTVGQLTTIQVDIRNTGPTPDSYTVRITATSPNIIYISNPTIVTTLVIPTNVTSVRTNIQTLTDDPNVINIQISDLTDTLNIPGISVNSKKFSLPEFGFLGFLQIVILASISYFIFENWRRI